MMFFYNSSSVTFAAFTVQVDLLKRIIEYGIAKITAATTGEDAKGRERSKIHDLQFMI